MAAPLGYAPYNSYPHSRLGSKGDFVAWAQQLLAGAGYLDADQRHYRSATQSAVYSYQAAHGLPQSSLDVPTWDLLLKENPLPVRWTKGAPSRPRRTTGEFPVLPPPKSATLPAVRDEIPPEERPRLGSEAAEDGPVGGDLEHGRHHRDPVFPRELGAELMSRVNTGSGSELRRSSQSWHSEQSGCVNST